MFNVETTSKHRVVVAICQVSQNFLLYFFQHIDICDQTHEQNSNNDLIKEQNSMATVSGEKGTVMRSITTIVLSELDVKY